MSFKIGPSLSQSAGQYPIPLTDFCPKIYIPTTHHYQDLHRKHKASDRPGRPFDHGSWRSAGPVVPPSKIFWIRGFSDRVNNRTHINKA
ncbi:hypothetical protein AFLA_000375 [Aspergillus flavus NRRL3357]|nr:hypothetical protein AFLA_000375 [Aspergillus flavus NRRL3357]